jgi:MATE family multidrug resistance protein
LITTAAAAPPAAASPPGAPRAELPALLRLAAPLIAGQAGNQLMSFVDTAFVGRLGPAALGGVGIGNGLYFALTIVGMGCVMGMDPLVAQAHGAGELGHARRIYWQGVRVALLVGVPLTALVSLTPLLLGPAGVNPETAAQTRLYLIGRLPNVVPFLLFSAARSYLQAHDVTRPIVVSMVVSNVVNFFGDALLIYGDEALAWVGLAPLGVPRLGVLGAGLASSASSVLSAVVLARAIAALDAPPDPGRRRADARIILQVFRLGRPLGLQLLAEVGVFALVGVLAGRLGKVPSAGHQVALTLASFTFTVALGVSSATAVRVGQAVGRADTPGARRAGFTGLALGAAFMACSAIAFVSAPRALAHLLSDDAAVIAAAAPLLMIAAVFQIFDGLQGVGAGALRGAGDTRAPLWANLVGHYAVGLPLALLLCFGRGLGAAGLWWGLSAGLITVALGLVARFAVLSARPIARV